MNLGFQTFSAAALALGVVTNAYGQGTPDDHNRLYLSLSGLWVEQNDADFEIDDLPGVEAEITFDDGFGVVAAIGQELPNSPFRLEFEYAYREAETETIDVEGMSAPLDSDVEIQSFMLNGIIDFKLGDGPFGVYAGAGLGVAITRFDIRSINGIDNDRSEWNSSFAYQGLAGVTFEVGDNAELFGGVRWFDALEVDITNVQLDTSSIDFEAGLRFFF